MDILNSFTGVDLMVNYWVNHRVFAIDKLVQKETQVDG